jgi:acetyl esterase
MSLHPQARAILDYLASVPPLHTRTVADARAFVSAFGRAMGPGEPVASVEDRLIPAGEGALPIRIYTPDAAGPRPILVYFHGGGWTVGDLDSDDHHCRQLCNAAACIVVSVDYRHAPEHQFPAAPQDAYDATVWVYRNADSLGGDPQRLAVGGVSAGGNLAAVVSLMARDSKQVRIRCQCLIVPALDVLYEGPSHRDLAVGFGLERATMDWFRSLYLARPEDAEHIHVSPLRAPDLRSLPPALIVTAQYDPIRDEGLAYAERLRADGVPVTYSCREGMIHLHLGTDAFQFIAAQLRQVIESP